MMLKFKTYLLAAIWLLAIYLGWSDQARANQQFIYDAAGRRDPFVPLLDQEQPSGLRSAFIAPETVVRLPFEVKLEGILYNGKEYFAVINKQVLKKGGNLGRVKIKEIEKNKVVLEYGQKEFPIFLRKEQAK